MKGSELPDWFSFSFHWNFYLFIVLGIVFGRVGAILTEIFSNIEKGDTKGGFFSFCLKCQNDWGWLPCSWVAKKIKREKPPFRPFAIELLMAVLFVLLLYFVGWKYVLLEYLLFTFALVVASAVDLEQMILPDSLTLSGIFLGLTGALLNPEAGREFWPALSGMLMGGGFLWFIAIFYYALRKEEGLGGGDIKLLAWIGAVLTWKAIPFVILLSCFMGLFAGIVIMFQSKNYLRQTIPFGPYLAFSAIAYIFWGEELSRMYLSVFFMR